MRETRFQSLGWEDALEKEIATHSSTLAWEILWTEEPNGLQSMGSQRDFVTKQQQGLLQWSSVKTWCWQCTEHRLDPSSVAKR